MNIKILVISILILAIFEFILFFIILKIHKIDLDSDFIEDDLSNHFQNKTPGFVKRTGKKLKMGDPSTILDSYPEEKKKYKDDLNHH